MKDTKRCCSTGSDLGTKGKMGCCSSNSEMVLSSVQPCPRCGKTGRDVPDTAVKSLLKEEYRSKLENGNYHICVNQGCQVVYYNPIDGQIFDKDSVRVKVWFKDPGDNVPLCYCNEITRSMIKEAWQKGARTYAEVVNITGAASGKCNCKYENPAGRCCSGVIKEFLDELEKEAESNSTQNRLQIEFLYLDLSTCSWCKDTESNLDEAIAEVAQVLRATGTEVSVKKVHVQSEEQSRELGFISSPTIRVNGNDIQLDVKESQCESCGDLCGETVDCRIWTYQGKEYTAPPKAMIIEAILREVYGGTREKTKPERYLDVPENLKKFFVGKRRKENINTQSGGCCTNSSNNSSC